MKKFLSSSFRYRLFAAFLAVSLIPLLICSAMLLQIFRLRMTGDAQKEAEEHLERVGLLLDESCQRFLQAAQSVQRDDVLKAAMLGAEEEEMVIYGRLLDATQESRSNARFDLYDREGRWLCSTRSDSAGQDLPTNWGVLRAAEESTLRFFPPEETLVADEPLLQGAVTLTGDGGERIGYLLVGLCRSDLDRLLEGIVGASNDLLILSAYWRPIYCSQPALADGMAATLRQRLLEGESLNSGDAEFTYTVSHHEGTGLYLVLRQPQVFNRDTMGLLYTVSLSSALVCVVISVLMSLTLSKQMFRPIQRLHGAIEAVARNDLDVYVPHEHDDELGQLAQRFNEMLVALKRNQEQLVENQKELNEAQIRMLQAQLNPHFLCNTLDTMKWISKINKVPQVADMSTNLADILRFCVSPDEFVPLWRELEILHSYVEIQRIRISGGFEFSVEVPPELEDCLVPKMILQPIAENAILHGLDGVEQGAILVQARAEEERLFISVQDNGRGLPPELEGPYARRDRELSRGHLGLYNVDTILRKHYGEGCGLYLSNVSGGSGACITAVLPLRWEEELIC
ncbi:sensor histidine kinase [Intestinimonas aquisgranensis]|nr:sensor histidine kinase [Intestinimonas aquisgranensis]